MRRDCSPPAQERRRVAGFILSWTQVLKRFAVEEVSSLRGLGGRQLTARFAHLTADYPPLSSRLHLSVCVDVRLEEIFTPKIIGYF